MTVKSSDNAAQQGRSMGRKKKRAMRSVLQHSEGVMMHALPFLNSRDITVKRAGRVQTEHYLTAFSAELHQLSFLSRNFLYGNLMLDDLTKDPPAILQKLEEYYAISRDRKYHFMAADLCHWLAINGKEKEALPLHLTALYYCQSVIIQQNHSESENASGEGVIGVENLRLLQIYNFACLAVFRHLKDHDLLHCGDFSLMGIRGEEYHFRKPQFGLSVPEEQIVDFELCADYTVTGLRQMNWKCGAGIPLVGWLAPKPLLHSLRTPPGMTIPVTFWLQLNLAGRDTLEIRPSYQDVTLQETRPLEQIGNGNLHFPLALDFTTPLACFQAKLPARNTLSIMLNSGAEDAATGLYLIEPYNPAKIPVVCVHGLLSTAGTWMEMLNTLKNDPLVRKRYQFWFFSYSSGAPILSSACRLNGALMEAHQELCTTPEARRNFEKMVILGHSMGGLVTRLLLRHDAEHVPGSLLRQPWEELRESLSPELREMLEAFICFKASAFVRRAVFLATPHRGAKMARRPIARLGTKLIDLAPELQKMGKELMPLYREHGKYPEMLAQLRNQFFTGLDNLDPGSLFVQVLQQFALLSGVKYHSIIGNQRVAGVPGGSDGIVSYSSSHLEGGESECIVKSKHNVQRNPAAMQEVLRILLQHLQEMDAEAI